MKLTILAIGLTLAAAGGSQLVADPSSSAQSAVQSAPQDGKSKLCDWLTSNDADSMVLLPAFRSCCGLCC